MTNIDVYLITPIDNTRNKDLVKFFQESEKFTLVTVPAIMTPNMQKVRLNNLVFDNRIFRMFSGRDFLAPEIGCAASHNEARRMIANSGADAIVIEDDAEVHDIEKIFDLIELFREATKSDSFVLSLTDFLTSGREYRNESPVNQEVSFVKLLGHPPLAVATYMSSLAARRLLSSNSPISWVSDWPSTECDYFVATSAYIRHSVEPELSLIDSDNFLGRNTNRRIRSKITSTCSLLLNLIKGPLRYQYFERIMTYKILHRIDKAKVTRIVNSLDS